jgi:Protein of unknown function, DUF547
MMYMHLPILLIPMIFQAFALNVFNMMQRYAWMKVGIPVSESCRQKFFDQIKFQVSGFTFSLQEWVDGVLRGNRRSPVSKTCAFSKKDPRCALGDAMVIYKRDYRIHFAIHCWSRSRRSSPVKTFTAAAIEEELAFVAHAFSEDDDNVAFNISEKKMRLAQVFRRYKSDFVGKTGRSVPQVVLEFLYGPRKTKLQRYLMNHQTMKMSSRPEDWTVGISDFVVFDTARLAPNVTKLQKCVRNTALTFPDSSRGDKDNKDCSSVDGHSVASSQTSGMARWLPTVVARAGSKVGNRSQPNAPSRLNSCDGIPKSVRRSRGGSLRDSLNSDVDESEGTLLLDDNSSTLSFVAQRAA